jgi:hypothetical protein
VAVHSKYLIVVNGKEKKVPYNLSGAKEIKKLAEDKIVLLAGNWKWAKTLAYFLKDQGFEIRYLPLPQKARGTKMSAKSQLKKALEQKIKGRPFFSSLKTQQPHPWLSKARQYLLLKDDIRRVKLRIIDRLRLICVEVMENPQKIWTKKGRKALIEQDWEKLIKIATGKYPKEKLLIEFIPSDEKAKATEELSLLLDELERLEEKEIQLKEEIMEMTKGHKISLMFDGSFSATVLALLIGWRKWQKFRHLRSYCGLAVKRIDSRGKLRISRVRPETRMTLFLLMRTKKAKEIVSEGLRRRGRERAPLPKRMEILLKEIWKNCLVP